MSLLGRWLILEMDLWDQDAVNLLVPGFFEFHEDRTGRFSFIAVQGWMDLRPPRIDNRPGVEFSWEGVDDNVDASGRGWAILDGEGSLQGRIFFHMGDDSGFRARRDVSPT